LRSLSLDSVIARSVNSSIDTAPAVASASGTLWRPMQERDLVAVAALEALAHPAPWTSGNFRDALTAGYSTVVGEAGGAIVAYGVLMIAPGEAQILNLTVAPAARRRGLARALLRRFLGDAIRLGAEQCFLEVRLSNAAAIALYRAEGFVPVARRAGYYPPADGADAREDALVLRRAVNPVAETHGSRDHRG
jgi:[ribosomal protein S18]-alanine N-acetyltransferase